MEFQAKTVTPATANSPPQGDLQPIIHSPPFKCTVGWTICPKAKSGVSYGPGQGGGFWRYYDHRVYQGRENLRNLVLCNKKARLEMEKFKSSAWSESRAIVTVKLAIDNWLSCC